MFELNFDPGVKNSYIVKPTNKNSFEDAIFTFGQLQAFWRTRLIDMVVSAITWKGLEFVPKNKIEYYLCIQNGMAAYFEDPVIGGVVLPCVGEGELNAYGLPSTYAAFGENGYYFNGLVDGENCVVIYNNNLPSTDVNAINIFSNRLANSMLTGEINMQVQKTPFIIETTEDTLLSLKNVMAKLTSGVQKIFTTKGFISEENLRVHDLKAPFLVDKITENTQIVWNEWLNYIGVPSQIVQKRERMLKDEVTQTMGGALASRTGRMGSRKRAAESIKKIFGREVEVFYTVDKEPIPEYVQDQKQFFNSIREGEFD